MSRSTSHLFAVLRGLEQLLPCAQHNACSTVKVSATPFSQGAKRHGLSRVLIVAVLGLSACLASPAIAAIAVQDALVKVGPNPQPGVGANASTTDSTPFTVTVGANVLVVQFSMWADTGPPFQSPTVTWGSQTLTQAFQEVSAANTHVYADVYYLFNPTPGTNTLTTTNNLRASGLGVFSLSGVNTSVLPIVNGTDTNTGTSSTVSLTGLTPGSLAVVTMGDRLSSTFTSYSLADSVSGNTASVQWGVGDSGNNAAQGGGLDFIGSANTTATITETQANSSTNRNEIAAAVFTPVIAVPVTWTGGSGSDPSWSNGANWSGGSAAGATTGTSSTGLAVFNAAYTNPGMNIPIVIDPNRNIYGITFDTGALNSILIGASNLNNLSLSSGGTIQTTATVGSVQAVNAPLALEGSYTFTSGSTTTTPAALNFGGAISGATGLGSSITLTLNGASTATNTISGPITNGGATSLGLSVGGSTWVLTNTGNTYTGGTTVGTGTLRLGAGSSLGTAGGSLTVNSGVLDLDGNSQTVGAFNGTGGAIVNDSNTSITLTVNGGGAAAAAIANNNNSNTTTGTISLIVGGGTLTLSGASSYTGGTTIAAGTLALAASSTGTSPITSGPAGTGSITLNLGGTLQINDGPFTVANPIQVTGGSSGISTIQNIASSTHTDTLSGTITLSNPLTLTTQATNAAGLLTLAGNITGTATTGNTTTLTLTGTNTGTASTVGAGENYAASQISGVIADGTGGGNVAILKTGVGAWRLTTTNSYTGGTTISAGSIEIGASAGAAGAGALGSGPVNVAAGAQLAFDFVGGTVTNNITLNGDTTINGLTGALIGDNLGGGGNNTLSGTLTLAGGVMSNVGTSWNDKSITLQGLVSGTGGLEVDLYHANNASPVVIVTDALNTYALGTLVNNGTLEVSGATAISGGAIATGPIGVGPLTLSGGTFEDRGAAVTLANALNITASSTFTTTGGGSITFDPTGLATPTTTTLSNSPTITVNNTTTIKEVIGGTGFTLAGGGTLVLGVANTYTGGTTISSGVLRIANTNAAQNSTVTVNANGGLAFSAGLGAATLGGLAGTGRDLLQDSTPAAINLSVGNNNATTTFSGVLAGLGSLTKIGSGALVLGNVNEYSGPTTITSGTLRYGISDPTVTQTIRQALASPTTAGNQVFGGATNATATGGTLGTEFVVPASGITVTGLGLFAASNNTGSSVANPIVTTSHEVAIFSVTSPTVQTLVASLNDTAAQWNAGTASIDGYRFLTLTTPVFLPAGTYDIASDGWGTDENYNSSVAGGVGLDTMNTVLSAGANNLFGGASTQGTNAFPNTTDGVLKYSAANFDFYGGHVIPGAVTINGSTAALDMAGNSGTVTTVVLDGGGTITSSSGTGTLTSNTAFNLNFGSVSSGVILAGTAGLTKSTGTGGNLVTLGGVHTYTGATTVNDGTLRVTGTLPSASAVTVGSASVGLTPILAGTGTINGPVTVLGSSAGSAGTLAPGAGGSAGSVLTISGPLTLGAGSILNFTLTPTIGGAGNDQVFMSGNSLLTVGANGAVNIAATGSLTQGTYVLISNPFGTASGTGAGWVANVTGDTSHSYSLAVVGSNFDLTVGVAPDVWTGATNGVWDINTTPNWSTSSGKYIDGDNVIFDDTGANTTNITITGTVNPTSMAFNNVAKAYIINSGTIGGTAQLTLTKGGTLTLNNTNNFTGATTVSGGSTLNIDGTYSSTFITVSGSGSNLNVPLGGSIAAGTNLTLNTSAAASLANGSQTLATLGGDGTGTLTLSGTALTLTGSGTVGTKIIDNGSGAALTISGGAVSLTNGANNYGGGTSVMGGGTLTVPTDGTTSGTNTPLGAIPGSPTTNLTINGGTFRASGTYALATSRTVAVGPSSGSGSGTIDVTGANTLTIAGAIGNNGGGSGQLIKTDTGTLTLTGTNNLSGGIAINGGTVQATNSANLGNGPITFGAGATGSTLSFFNPAISTYISGFGTGTGFQLNTNTAGIPTISSGTLTLTNTGGGEGTSAIYTTKVPVGAFTAQFTYRDTAAGAGNNADGATFFLQNNSTTAVGGTGGGLGYSGITSSVAFVLNIYTGAAGGVGYEVTNNGTVGTNVSASPVNLASGDPILVTLSYNGTTLTYTLTDQSNNNTYTNSTAINIPSFMAGGSSQAYAGFTGGTGGQEATQTFSNFTYTSNGTSTPLAISQGASVTSGSTGTISISGYPSATIPSLAFGSGSTLNVTGASLTSSGTSFSGSATINTGLGVTVTTGPITGSIGSGNSLTKTGSGTLNVNQASDGGPNTFTGSTVNINGGSLTTLAGTTTSGLGTSNWALSGANLTITGTAVSGSGLAGNYFPLSPGDNGNAAPYSNGTGKAPNTLLNNWPTGNATGGSSSTDDATIAAFGTPPSGFSNVTLPTTANVVNPTGGPAYTYTGGINFPNSGNTVNAFAAIGIDISGGNGTAGTGGNSPPYSGATSGYNSISAQWKGTVTLTTAGTLNLAVNSDDFAAIAVDGTIVAARGNGGTGFSANNGGAATSPGGGSIASVSLTAGIHSIEVLYDEGGGGWGIITGYNFNGGNTGTSSFPFAIGQNDSTDGISFAGPIAGPALSNQLSVSGTSSLTLNAGTGTSLGSLSLNGGANLTVNGTSSSATFANTVVNGSVTFSNTIPVITAVVSNGATPNFTSLTMSGGSQLFLDNTGNTAFASGTTIHAAAGTTVGVTAALSSVETDSLGAATLDVDGGALSLGSDASVAFANPITVSASGSITAQQLGSGAVAGNTISLSGGIAANTGTLTLNTNNNYTLNLTSPITGAGTVTDTGTVNLNAANPSYTGTFNVTNGTTTDNTVAALATASAVNVTAGILNVQAADTLKTLTASGGNTNLNVNNITLSGTSTVNSGGTVNVAGILAAAGPINVAGGGTVNVATTGNLTNATLTLGSAANLLQSSALAVVTGAGSLGSGTINVNSSAELRFAAGTGASNYAGTTINVNSGLVHVASGNANVGTAVINVTPAASGGTNGLTAYIYPGMSNGADANASGNGGVNVVSLISGNVNGTKPTNSRILTAASTPHADGIDFRSDSEMGTYFGNTNVANGCCGGDNYTSVFFGHFTAPTTGSYNFAVTGVDDNAYVYVDTNNGTNFTQVAAQPNCCSNTQNTLQGTQTPVSLTAGQTISIVFTQQDNGGGSDFDAGFELPGNTSTTGYTIIGPGATGQTGYWSYSTATGGGTIQVDAGASLAAGGFVTASNVSLANGSTMTLSAPSNNFTSSTTQLSVIGTTPSATFGFAGSNNHTVNVTTLSIATGGTLNLTNSGTAAGVLNLTGAGDPANTGTLRVGSGASLSGTGSASGAVTVLSGGTVIGNSTATPLTIAGTLTLNAGSILSFTLPVTPNSSPLITVGTLAPPGSGSATVNISPTGLASGTYDLLNYGSGPAAAATAANFTLGTSAPNGFLWTLTTTGSTNGQLDLTVQQLFAWTGHPGGNGTGAGLDLWDTSTTNWANGTPATALAFINGSPVSFGDTNPIPSDSAFPPDGTVTIVSGGVTPSSVTFSNNAVPYTLSNQGGDVSSTAGISGSANVVVGGGGQVTFTGKNTYSGSTTISGGSTLNFTNGNQLGSGNNTNSLVLTGGTLNENATGGTPSSPVQVSLAAAQNVLLGNSSNPGTISTAANTQLIVPGAVQDSTSGGTLRVAGSGTLVLTGTNTYSGTTTINSGSTLQIGNGLGGGTLGSGNVVANGSLVLNQGASVNVTNNISGASTGSVTVSGSTNATLAPTTGNSYSGATNIAAGTLIVGNNNALPSTTSVILGTSTGNDGTLDLDGNNATIAGLSVASGANPSFQTVTNDVAVTTNSTLTFAGGSGTSTYSGVIQDNAFSFSSPTLALAVTSGTLNLSGAGNIYTGGTTITGGTLSAQNPSGSSATGLGAVNVSGTGTLSGGGTSGGYISPSSGNAVTIASGGTIVGGTTSAPLHITTTNGGTGQLVLQTGSISQFTPTTPGTSSPLISVNFLSVPTGLGNNALVSITNGASLIAGDTYELIGFNSGPGASNPANNFAFVAGQSFGSNTASLLLTSNQLDLVIQSGATGPTSTTYTLAASAANTIIHSTSNLGLGPTGAGKTTAGLTSTITNSGTSGMDTLDYTGLSFQQAGGNPTGGSIGSITTGSGTALALGATSSGAGNGTATFSSSGVGNYVINPIVGTATNHDNPPSGSATNSPANTSTTVQVNYYAQPAFTLANGSPGSTLSGALTGSGASYTLTLNVPNSGTGSPSATLTLVNTSLGSNSFQDNLAGSFASYSDAHLTASAALNGGTLSAINPGSTNSGSQPLTLTYSTATSSSTTASSITLNGTSVNTGSTSLTPITISVQLVAQSQTGLTSNSTTAGDAFGAAATWSVQNNATLGGANAYTGLASGASGQSAASNSAAAASGYGPLLSGLTAQIVAGSNSGTFTGNSPATLSMAWRNRSLSETSPQEGGTPTAPPLQYVGSYLISNVLNLSGLGTSSASNQSAGYNSAANTPYFGAASVTEHETDPFVLQMTYSPTLLSNEAGQAKKGTIYLGWLAPAGPSSNGNLSLAAPTWQKANTGDFNGSGQQTGTAANGPDALTNFQGTFAAFLSAENTAHPGLFSDDPTLNPAGLSSSDLTAILGSYGVDTTGHDVWAVINHNSQFAVVPEPSTLLLAVLGLAGLAGYRIRRKRSGALS